LTETLNPMIDRLRAIALARWLKLFCGLICFGIGIALMIDARVGIPPWDVLHQGVSKLTGLRIGTVTTLMAVPVLSIWALLRERPGIGTIANALVIGPVVNIALPFLPAFDNLALQLGQVIIGMLIVALGTVVYIGAALGPGPRDGLMTGLARRTGLSVRVCRTAIEVTVLAIGWLLGGNVGVGTLIFALGIGPSIQLIFKLLGIAPPAKAASTTGQSPKAA
jgi:uncharacterized membrane protein YczE